MKHNWVKNPNWPGANQLAIYKHGGGFELGTTVNKSSLWSGRDLNSGPRNCKSGALTTRPRCLLIATAVSLTPGITTVFQKLSITKMKGERRKPQWSKRQIHIFHPRLESILWERLCERQFALQIYVVLLCDFILRHFGGLQNRRVWLWNLD